MYIYICILYIIICIYIYRYHQTSDFHGTLLFKDIPPGNRSAAAAGADEAGGAQSGESGDAGAQSGASHVRWRSSACRGWNLWMMLDGSNR